MTVDGLVAEARAGLQRVTPEQAAARDHDLDVIVVCQEGYASSLAAASLQRLGLRRATDVVGGFLRWRDEGIPVTAGR